MLKDLLKSKYFYIFLGAVVAVLLLIFFALGNSRAKPPVFLGAIPRSGYQRLGLVEPLTLSFTDSINPADFTLTSTPATSWELIQINEQTLKATPTRSLKPESPYALLLSWRGQKIAELFYTTEVTQTDYDLIEDIKDQVTRDFPLASHIPLVAPSYRVVYSAPLELEITLLSAGISAEQAVAEIKSWVTSQGGDASKHQYKVIPFSNN